MLFYIGLNFLATLKLIELQLDVFKTRLEAMQVEKYFETEGLRVDNIEYIKAPQQLTFTEGMLYCKRSMGQIFTPKHGQPVRKIFTTFNLQAVWTSIYKQDSALIDGDGFPPELDTDLETIGLQRLALSEMTDSKHRVVLTRVEVTDLADTPFQLERRMFTEKASVVCVKNLSFPFKATDVVQIKKFVKKTTTRLEVHQTNIKEIKARTTSVLATLPRIGEGVNIVENDIIDVQAKLTAKLGKMRVLFDTAITDIQLIRNVVELSTITADLQATFLQLYVIIDQIQEPLRFPLGLISAAYHPYIETVSYNYTDDVSSQVVLFYVNDTMLLLKVGSEKSKLQAQVSQTATFFNKRYFYSVTLIDLILVVTSSLVSLIAMIGIIMNCFSIRQNYKRHKQLLRSTIRYEAEPKVRKVKANFSAPTFESHYRHDIGLPTTMTNPNRRVRFFKSSQLPSHLAASNLSL